MPCYGGRGKGLRGRRAGGGLGSARQLRPVQNPAEGCLAVVEEGRPIRKGKRKEIADVILPIPIFPSLCSADFGVKEEKKPLFIVRNTIYCVGFVWRAQGFLK